MPRKTTRRSILKSVGGAATLSAVGGLSGCLAAGDRQLRLDTVAVESDVDGEFYYPTQEHIESGAYSPLTRPLYIYVNHATLAENPSLIGSFVRFYIEGQHDFAREVGYYATTDEVREANHARLDAVLDELGVSTDGEPSGTVTCTGSNTVAPVTDAAAEDFENLHPRAQVNVNPQGTGAGFSEFTRGQSDVQSASREILPSEQETAERNGVEYSRYEIGWDGLAIVKHADNDWCDRLTLDELRRIWEFRSDVKRWNDLNEDWPNRPMMLYGRDTASGTFDYFTEAVTGEIGNIRDDYSPHSQTYNIMEGVGRNVYGLGWGAVGYYHALRGDGE